MQHPDNRIVIPITDKKLYLTNIYECVNDDTSNIVNIIDLNIISKYSEIETPKKIIDFHNIQSISFFHQL